MAAIAKRSLKRRSTWVLSMVACGAFLIMAAQSYQLSSSELLGQLATLLVVMAAVLGGAAVSVTLLVLWRRWRQRTRR